MAAEGKREKRRLLGSIGLVPVRHSLDWAK
jgi:hypothetical protein